MKHLFKNIARKAGYTVITDKLYKKLVEINTIPSLDFTYLLRNIFSHSDKLVIFDIGANEGQTAIKFNGYYPEAEIHCFEPIKATFDLLVNNVKNIEQIKTYNFAFGDEVSEVEIFHRQYSQLNSLVKELNEIEKSNGATSESVNINTIDNFLKNSNLERIHILKSDTEGFEMNVLKGGRSALTNQVFDFLYFEVGFAKSDRQHTYLVDMINFLEPFNYRFSGLFEMDYKPNLTISYANALFVKC